MTFESNPFQFDAANNLTDEMIADYYIDDYNYGRFLHSKRNVFLVGERGSGKTMALLHATWRLQKLLAERRGEIPSLSTIGVYVPCNTPLTHKAEYQLLGDFQGEVLSEHFLALSIAFSIADTLGAIPNLLDGSDEEALQDEASFVLGGSLPSAPFFEAIKRFLQRELLATQRTINSGNGPAFYENTFSFASVVVPLLAICTTEVPKLRESHFLLLLDDAHALNEFQVRALNSWIAYRDHSLFSFKVAVAKVGTQAKITSSGGSLLEGHDYTQIDLEAPLQSKDTNFYQLARKVVERRLRRIAITISAEDFFPVSAEMEADLHAAEEVVRRLARRKFGNHPDNRKAVSDYIYKYKRAHYFRSRSRKANKPPYSGFQTLVFLSTGVLRNLLEPCYWMFDNAVSARSEEAPPSRPEAIAQIPSSIQTKVIIERSERQWDWLRDSVAQDIEECSTESGQHAYNLLDALARHFRDRLLDHTSEPRALSFTISQRDPGVMAKLTPLIEILRKAQLLYIRSGPAKDAGQLEPYYVPNRILWPARGLDPHGQHARVSIPAASLWSAAEEGHAIRGKREEQNGEEEQIGLWDDQE